MAFTRASRSACRSAAPTTSALGSAEKFLTWFGPQAPHPITPIRHVRLVATLTSPSVDNPGNRSMLAGPADVPTQDARRDKQRIVEGQRGGPGVLYVRTAGGPMRAFLPIVAAL